MNLCLFVGPQLAKYCDMLLRKGFKGSSESELEEKLDEAVRITLS